MIYRVNFRLDTKNPKHKMIADFIIGMIPRSNEKKDFIIDALADAIQLSFYSNVKGMAEDIMGVLSEVKKRATYLEIEDKVPKPKQIESEYLVKEKDLTPKKSKNSMDAEEDLDLDSILEKLKGKAFE